MSYEYNPNIHFSGSSNYLKFLCRDIRYRVYQIRYPLRSLHYQAFELDSGANNYLPTLLQEKPSDMFCISRNLSKERFLFAFFTYFHIMAKCLEAQSLLYLACKSSSLQVKYRRFYFKFISMTHYSTKQIRKMDIDQKRKVYDLESK